MSKKMTDKEAEAIEKLKEISFMTGYKQALDLAIKALEVVGKIKKVCYSNENDFIDDTIKNIKQKKKQSNLLESFVCNKTPYKVGDTWNFIAEIDSGDITHNINRNVHVGTSKYPVVTTGENCYQSGSFTADLLSLYCPSGEIYDNISKVNKWIKFINDDCLFILKSDKGDVWIVAISDNTTRIYDESVDQILTKVSYSWVEVCSPDTIQIVEIEN